ncbi:MAG: phytanoyl-CoA dioxygenase family protein [Pseudomonadota bacterium]
MLFEKQDLSFEPVANARPKVLSAEQVKGFNTDGFCQPIDIFSPNEMRHMRGYIDKLIAGMGEKGSYGINCYQARLSGLYDIATDHRIIDYVQDLIGPNILCWASAILSKKPRDPKHVPWHQDASFWMLSPARTVTVWLAIDDADEHNSAMRFIPGSHKFGPLETSKQKTNSVFHKGTKEVEGLGMPFTNCLKSGQISLHADMLVHGSLPNISDRRRCGLTLRYCPPEVRIIDDDWKRGVEAILCCGDAKTWTTHPRPSNDDITATTSPVVVANN